MIQALRKRRVGEVDFIEEEEEIEKIIPLEKSIDDFWELGASLDGFSVNISIPTIKTPLLKRLGEASFVPKPGIEALLQKAYSRISEKAVELAYGDGS